MVNSTMPKLGAKWPPLWEVTSIRRVRISVARVSSDSKDKCLRSLGECILLSITKINLAFEGLEGGLGVIFEFFDF